MPQIPPPAQAVLITSFLRDHPRWSVFWDKRYRTPTCTPKQEMPTP
jgi:hypothetical protein